MEEGLGVVVGGRAMRAGIVGLVLVAALAAGAVVAQSAPPMRTVQLRNATGVPLAEVRVRAEGEADWRATEDPLPAGALIDVEVPLEPASCRYEIRAVYANGSGFDQPSDLCRQIGVLNLTDPMDAPGRGRGDDKPAASPVVPPPGPVARGVPTCPGDPRCRGKKK